MNSGEEKMVAKKVSQETIFTFNVHPGIIKSSQVNFTLVSLAITTALWMYIAIGDYLQAKAGFTQTTELRRPPGS